MTTESAQEAAECTAASLTIAEKVRGIPKTRYAAYEDDGKLTFRVVRPNRAIAFRIAALVLSMVAVPIPLLVTDSSSAAAGLIPVAAGGLVFLWVSGRRFARDVRAPKRGLFRRVLRLIEISLAPADGYRQSAGGGTIRIDRVSYGVRDVRSIPVLVIVTEDMGKYGIVETKEWVPAIVFGDVVYELDRFTDQGDAQRFANAMASACSIPAAGTPTSECPPWNPYRDKGWRAHLYFIGMIVGGLGLGLVPSHLPRTLLVTMLALALLINVVVTEADGQRIAKMRTSLVQGLVPELAAGSRQEAEVRTRQHAAPPVPPGRRRKTAQRGRK
jgi:hypothetical protein